MKLTQKLTKAAQEKADLYGVRFDGFQERPGGKAPAYTWTDLVTGTTFVTPTIGELPGKLIQSRRKFANPKRSMKKAVELSRRFYGLAPRQIRRVNITWPRALVCIGAGARIDYISDKFDGKVRRYFHEFEKEALVYIPDYPQPDGKNLIIIHGNFEFQPEGITG